MKRSSVASRRKVTAENLAGLGVERLAALLVDVAETRPDLKRRLRMELAAEQGAQPLISEIDKRLASFETNRARVSWRQLPAFLRDLDALRDLITERLGALDRPASLERLWRFLDTARGVASRLRSREEALAAVFARAADDLGAALAGQDPRLAAEALTPAMSRQPSHWVDWLPRILAVTPPSVAEHTLRQALERPVAAPGWISLVRRLADAAGDAETFRSTYSSEALITPPIAAEVARRFLREGQIEEAGAVLRAAAQQAPKQRPATADFDWESVWIDYLEQSGALGDAQAVRWASFERTLSAERLKAYTSRLADFDDVEAEGRAFAVAAGHKDFEPALRLLMEWPALPEAAQMIVERPDDVRASADDAEAWADRLRRRYPAAAHLLLRKVAAAAFRRRDFKTCDRLTEEADGIAL
jgi:hypothetical protein